MAVAASIVVNDASSVSHTFAVANTGADVVRWEDRSTAIYVGYDRVTLSLRRPVTKKPIKGQPFVSPKNRNLTVWVKIEKPILEIVGASPVTGFVPPPTVAYTLYMEQMFTLPERSLPANRADLYEYSKQILADTQIEAAIKSFIISS